jgi:predicted aspartyl protease
MIESTTRMSRLLAAIWISAAAACVPCRAAEAPPPVVVELAHPEISLPMESFEGRPQVELKVNGHGPYPFILDTAASGSRVSPALVAELGLEPVGEAQVRSGVGSAVPMKLYELDSLTAQDLTLRKVGAVVVPSIDPKRPNVLGVGALGGVTLVLDFPAHRIGFSTSPLPPADGVSVFETAAIPLSLAARVGETSLRVHPDTGSSSGLEVSEEVAQHLPLTSEPRVIGSGQTVNSRVEVKQAAMKADLVIGNNHFPLESVTIVPGLREPLMGCQLLRDRVLRIDTRNHRLQLSAAAAAGPLSGPRSGMGSLRQTDGRRFDLYATIHRKEACPC